MLIIRGKTIFQFSFIILLQLTSTSCQLYLYNTDVKFQANSLEYNCLNYHTSSKTHAYQDLYDVIDEVIPYCFRPTDYDDDTSKGSTDPNSQKLNFEEIRRTGITAVQLLSWSIPIEVVERYQFYLDDPNPESNEYFYKCSEGRFGLRCQYSFPSSAGMSFNQIVEASFHQRTSYSIESDMIGTVPCYILLECYRNGQFWCLDWREVCDGKVDCYDDGLDEKFCFNMEMNVCNENERRCNNGLCISQDLWADDDTDCLDQSDRVIETSSTNSCFQNPTFRCEEYSYKDSNNQFTCGDGHYVSEFADFHNDHHMLLKDSISDKDNLIDKCWTAIMCLSGFGKKGLENFCDPWLPNSTNHIFMKQCQLFIYNQTVSFYSHHIYLFDEYPHMKSNKHQSSSSDYRYDDEQSSKSITSDSNQNNIKLTSFIEDDIDLCSIFQDIRRNKTNDGDYSSKYISKNRFMNVLTDCFLIDNNENNEINCLYDGQSRVLCYNATKCWSSLVKIHTFKLNNLEDLVEISFQNFCNGTNRYYHDNRTKQYHTKHEHGNCSCDNMWMYSTGQDEDNCNRTISSSQTYSCVSSINQTVFYLHSELVNDEITYYLAVTCDQDLLHNHIDNEKSIYTLNENKNCSSMHPLDYYSCLCQHQNERISLMLELTSYDRGAIYSIIIMLIEDHYERQMIVAHDQFVYITKQSSTITLNRYLLFSMQPKNISKNYSVRIHAYDTNTLTYLGSWYFPITFLFLPVNRLSISLNLSDYLLQHSLNECYHMCSNGECVKYVNKDKYFCHCFSQWSGIQCNISMNCDTCSTDSICIGSSNNQSICVCPIDKSGPRCLFISTCSNDTCQNNGKCIPPDISTLENNYTCICSEEFYGQNCEYRKMKLDVSFSNINIPLYLVGHFFTLSNKSNPIETILIRKWTYPQPTVTFRIPASFDLLLIQVDNQYYLAALQQSSTNDISISISPKQKCISVERITRFPLFCSPYLDSNCLIDKNYIYLCTNDHHINYIKFNKQQNFHCPSNNYCANDGQCLQDHPTSPSKKTCLCQKCFSGNRCQFNMKNFGITLNEILGYGFKRHTSLFEQHITIKVSAIITTSMSLIGIVNSILSIITFSRKDIGRIGIGIYFLALSTVSLLTMILFTLNFWFLFYSHQNSYGQYYQQWLFRGSCYIASLLKLFLYLNNWLYVCVCLERVVIVKQSFNFKKERSTCVARWIISLLFSIIICLYILQLIHSNIFNDDPEERSWFVVTYPSWLQIYDKVLLLFHYVTLISINIISHVFIIGIIAHGRAHILINISFWSHFYLEMKRQFNLLMVIVFLTCSSLSYLICSIRWDCRESSNMLWYYLAGYFLSFLPTTFTFIIFILPSGFYRNQFEQWIASICQRPESISL